LFSEEIEILNMWGPILFLVSMPFFMWILDNKGLRFSVSLTAFLVAFGSVLRTLPFNASVLR